jgi:predicted Zn-dependent protease
MLFLDKVCRSIMLVTDHYSRGFNMRIFLVHTCFLGAFMLLAACSTNPTSGRPMFSAISEGQEASMGAGEHPKIMAQMGGVNDTQELNFMVARIGARLAPHAERHDVRWTFTVLNDEMVNAFAVPGGYIYVTRGLLALAQDESQVAGVIAHEMGHVNARHSAQQMSQDLLANIGLQAIGIATGSNVATQMGGIGADLYMKGYSRSHEFEADALGVKYLAAAGYDPYAAAKFLQQLQRSTELEARIAGKPAGSEMSRYFSTHPQTPERVTRARALADALPKNPDAETGRTAYLNAIKGTIYGGDAKGGFVRGNEFIHPGLKIRFKAPEGFRIQNTDKAVIASNNNGAIAIFDTAKAATDDAGGFISNIWAPNANLGNQERITVNGLAGATASGSLNTSDGAKDAQLVALSAGPGQFYRLLFLAPQGQMGRYAESFRRSTYSFTHDADIAGVSPNRIRVVTARAGDTVQSLAARMQVTDSALERFCLINGLTPDSRINTGDQVKIVE